jgi:hypothetical protein
MIKLPKQMETKRFARIAASLVALVAIASGSGRSFAEAPPLPCTPNPSAAADETAVEKRGDVVNLPSPLKDRLGRLANRPHSVVPLQVFAEAPSPSQLFQYYLLDTTGFEPNVFTTIFPSVNDHVQLTATGANCGLPTVGAVRVVLEPKPGLPTDPNSPRAFIDVFTDISGLFVINNESGWYEGWMIHDMTVPKVNSVARSDGHAQFGAILPADAAILKNMGMHNNVPSAVFTVDGNAPHFPSAKDHFPDVQSNTVPIYVSMGAYNCLQQSDCHAYWEFNYQGTNWVHPLYELPFTGGFPDDFGITSDTFQDGEIGRHSSVIPGPGPGDHRTAPRRSAIIPAFRAIPTSLTRTRASIISASSESAAFPADWPTKSSSMFMSVRLRSNHFRRTWSEGCSTLTRMKSSALTPTITMALSPQLPATLTPPPTASQTTNACTFPLLRSHASPLPGRSTTVCWRRAFLQVSAAGC